MIESSNTSSLQQQRFRFLSLRDLLDARDAYHVHLANLDNVLATAVGRFRIRMDDPDARTESRSAAKDYGSVKPRTLASSVVRPWSWPCVLVFVKRWLSAAEFARQPDQAVPRFLYLPDGRVIPTCVVLTEERVTQSLMPLKFPEQLLGGGCPIISLSQGAERRGTVGCLVSDGRLTYALTNRHVVAAPGAPIFAMQNGARRRVGLSAAQAVARAPWSDVYPTLGNAHANVTLDAGLVVLDRVNDWTAQVFGMGHVGDPMDLHSDALSLDLIGRPVKACGGATGAMRGEIQALFYRYRTLGGFDEVTDFLIGPRSPSQPLETRPGDSGTVWFVDDEEIVRRVGHKPSSPDRLLRPVALQWGGHRLLAGAGTAEYQFALASNFSAACRALGVEVVRDWNTGYQLFWGQVGHYKVGHVSCSLLTNPKLKKLFEPNAHLIGISDQKMLQFGTKDFVDLSEQSFVALADVPDEIWRTLPTRRADESNHFADMDEIGKGPGFGGKTLLDICKKPEKVSVTVWNDFYDRFSIAKNKRGAVPFRVWQIYDEMVEFVRQKKVTEFFCAAGILGHYIGDCGQPLHVSRWHHGDPETKADDEVHSVYETQMLNRYRQELFAALNKALAGKKAKPELKGGHAAAVSVVTLMRNTIKTLRPQEILETYNTYHGQERLPKMWEALGQRTVQCMARPCLHLAMLWESAWAEGGGNKIAAASLSAPSPTKLKKLYLNTAFIKSYTLPELEVQKVLKGGPP